MEISKNKKHQYLFFFIISIYTVFNGGNSNILIQINFALFSLLFLYCLKDRNYRSHLNIFYIRNKFSILFYLLFLFYLIFQIIPMPVDFLKFFSLEKYNIIDKLNFENKYSSISLSPSNSFFQFLNFLTLIIFLFIIKMIFYTDRHINRLYLFLSFLGFISSFIAILLFLNGNPDFFFFKNKSYFDSSTGFFINRTVFSIFLLFCLISSFELLKKSNLTKRNKKNINFFLKIYIRLFIIFITIGIITSFSRIGNFLLLITIVFYLINDFFFIKNNDKSFRYIILLIVLFDIIIMGYYFGNTKIFERFYFIGEDLAPILTTDNDFNRFSIMKFSFNQFFDYMFFGYGSGSFETLFQIKFNTTDSSYANHAHSDIIEFIGEFGIFGFSLLILSILKFLLNIKIFNLINIILLIYLFIILTFDFSLHIPLIQLLLIFFYSSNKKFAKVN